MTAIAQLSMDFEGTDGVVILSPTGTPAPNPGAIGATLLTGGGLAQFSGADPQQGSTCLQCTGATGTQVAIDVDLTTPVTTFWDCWYLKTPSAAVSATLTVASWWGNGGTLQGGGVRMANSGAGVTLALRDLASNVATSGVIPLATWLRIAVKAIPQSATGHRMRLYIGANRHSASPDFDSLDQTATNGTNTNIDSFRFGLLTNGANTLFVDRNRADNATEPAGLSVGGPPTLTFSSDLTKEVGSGSFTVTGVASPAGGATIVSQSITVLSGVTVTLSGNTSTGASPLVATVTAPTTTTGSTVLTYVATDNTGQSNHKECTLTWVPAGQTLYPVADVSNPGAWTTSTGTQLFAVINDVVLDITTYIASPQLSATAAIYNTRLTSKPVPSNTTGWFLRINKKDLPDLSAINLVFALYEANGTTLIKTFTGITALSATDTEFQLTLTSGEVAAITSWASGLIVRVAETGS